MAKAWAPVFKFKFVSSAKHADFNSAKYANVVVKKDGGAQTNWATVNKAQLFSGSMKTLKQIKKDFPTYYRLKGVGIMFMLMVRSLITRSGKLIIKKN